VTQRIVGYHHVNQNIGREHIEGVRRFYRDVLGLEEISSAQQDPSGQRLMWFALGNGQLHLNMAGSGWRSVSQAGSGASGLTA